MEYETTAISTVITEAHMSIADNFGLKVSDILKQRNYNVNQYGVDITTYSESETLTLKIDDRRTLTVRLSTSK